LQWIPSNEKEEESIKETSRLLTTVVSLLALSIAKNLTLHDIQFGMGSRSCVGMNIAWVEKHKFISQFVRYFEIELVDKENLGRLSPSGSHFNRTSG
jgi:hypothetical protein